MKNIFLCLPFTFFLLSCNSGPVEEPASPEPVQGNGPVIEIEADYTLYSYKRPIDETSDLDFIDEATMNAMRSSKFYQKRTFLRTKTSSEVAVLDTLTLSEEIPFCANISESTKISNDGTAEYVQITELDPEMNPLLGFHETELDLSNCIAQIVVKDGEATTYNTYGEILSQQTVPTPDYSEYINEIALAKQDLVAETKAGMGRDINWLRSKMGQQCPTKSGEAPSYKIYEAGDRIILEQYMGLTKSGEELSVRTVLSSDITKNYGYEQLEDGLLKVRCTNYFDQSSVGTKSVSSALAEPYEENPSRTVIECLSTLSDGTPMISVSDRVYKINTVKINL